MFKSDLLCEARISFCISHIARIRIFSIMDSGIVSFIVRSTDLCLYFTFLHRMRFTRPRMRLLASTDPHPLTVLLSTRAIYLLMHGRVCNSVLQDQSSRCIKRGAIRRHIGPIKHHLTTRTTTLTDLLGEDLPQSEEDAATKLEELHEAQDNVKVSLRMFVEKHEAWTTILDAIEDDPPPSKFFFLRKIS